jgi:signal transduction histidine kinase
MARKRQLPASTRRAGSVDPATPQETPRTTLEQATRLIESERSQIAHEIHDGLLPLIFAASATASNLIEQATGDPPSSSLPKLRQLAAWLDEAMQTGRRVLTQVYPPELTDRQWTDAAADTVNRLLGETETTVHWNVEPRVNEISRPIALAAYRIVVEAARNAARHGKATEVLVDGKSLSDGIQVTIRDNGCGFDSSAVPPDRFGLRSMTARAELIGGSLEVTSKPGGPTSVIFAAPHQPA